MAHPLLTRFLPFLAWWPLTPLILRADLLAGVIGALVQVPKAMAYAQLAGLPLQYGLYAAFVPAIIGALWGSSRHLATGPVAVVSLMTAAAVTPLAVPGSEDYIGLVLLLTLLVGCIQFVLGVVKLGSAVNFVSHPVILGFMNAAAIIIGLSQLDMLFGIPKGRSDFFFKDVWEMLGYLPLTHLPTLAMSVFSLALMLVVKRIPVLARPGILMVVLITTLVSALVGFEHNATGRIDQIASPRAREIVDNYSRTAKRIETLNNGLTELATRIRQAEKEENLRAAADLRYRLDLLDLDIRAAEAENRNRLRVIRRMYFVRTAGDSNSPPALHQLGQEPDGLVTDGRRWRVKRIGAGEMQLMGGGEVVGAIPAGLPSFRLPGFSFDGLLQLLSAALVIALVGFMEAISMAKAMAGKVRQRIDPNQELIGQGLANIGGSFFRAYPASGSFTGSAINLQAGAQTGMAMVFNGVFIAFTLLFLTPYIHHLPKAVLAVIILLAVVGLLTPGAFVHIWKASRADGLIAAATFVVTLVAAPHLDKGIMIGALLAIGHYLYRTMAPRVAILGRHEDGTLRDVKVHTHLATSSKVVVIRFDGSLYFANIAHFEDAVLGALADHREALYFLIVGDAINSIDSSGEEMLHNLVAQLHQAGVEIVFSGLKKQILDVMRTTGLFTFVGEHNIFSTEDQALAAIADRLGEEERCNALFCRVG